jgi:acyl-CoA reductase-like NAD-dependent aldehyde dehydrogenase
VILHLVDGVRVSGGPPFEVRVAGGTRRYSRARAADLERALAALESGAPPPARVFERARELVERDEGWRVDLAAALDVEEHELPPRLAAIERSERRREMRANPAVVALVAHWSDGVGELGRKLCAPLAAGAAVLLCSDPRVPDAADVWCDALLDAGLPRERLALLHGLDTGELVRCAHAPARARIVVDDAIAAKALEGTDGARRWAVDWPQGTVLAAGGPGQPSPSEALDLAFGVASALGGQLDGRVGVIDVPARRHAAFVQELARPLEALAARLAAGARLHPRAIDRAMEQRHAAALQTLLEQGAAPIVVAERHGEPLFAPALFVNGEDFMAAVQSPPCVPLLVVRRV